MNFDWKAIIRKLACSICKAMGGKQEQSHEEPEPEPIIVPAGTIDLHVASSILLDKLEEMGDDSAGIYLPDRQIKYYRKDDVKNFLALDELDKIEFSAEIMDCDDFAAELFGKFAGLVWSNKHALNWFIDETETLWFIEPQNDRLAKALEGWQGSDIQFFIGR